MEQQLRQQLQELSDNSSLTINRYNQINQQLEAVQLENQHLRDDLKDIQEMKEQSIEKCDQLQQDYQQLQTNIQVLFRQNSEMKQDLERSSPLKIIVNEYLDPFLDQLPDIDTKIIFLRQIQQEFQQSQCDWNPKGFIKQSIPCIHFFISAITNTISSLLRSL